MDYVAEFLRRGMPLLQARAEQLRKDHPGVEVSVWESPAGSLTPVKGHDFGIECMWEPRSENRAQFVLTVFFGHLDRAPALFEASVSWSDGPHELELVPYPSTNITGDEEQVEPERLLTEARFETLVTEQVPKLLEALTRGLARVRSTQA